jgi:hypothetical protein
MFILYKSIGDLFSSKVTHMNDIIQINELHERIKANEISQENDYLGRIINSNVISVKMSDNEEVRSLKENPVRITFRHVEEFEESQIVSRAICVFLDYDRSSFDSQWSSNGCYLRESNKTHSVCECDHLTHFAILMDVYGVHQSVSHLTI